MYIYLVNSVINSTCRAVASYRQTQALASVIVFVFVVYSHHKHPKYRGREFNHEHCLGYYFSLASTLTWSINS